ncbi:MAG: TonB-dependent receptor [Caulobacteraceae bacterium]
MKSFYLAGAALSALLLPALAHADTATDVTDVSLLEITRLPTPPQEAPEVIVVGRDEIEARQSVFAMDILTTLPGLSVSRNGAFGGIATVRQRGALGDKTLVVIDGVPQNDPSSPAGGYDFANLDLADVDRIEVLSGPQGSLWGSDAIGGVISFTTRPLDGWRAALEAGTLATFSGSGGAGFARDGANAAITVSGFRTAGVSKADEGDGNTERDGDWTYNVALRGGVTLGPVELDGRLAYNRSVANIDGFPCCAFTLADTGEVSLSRSWNGHLRATFEGPWDTRNELTYGYYDLDRASVGGDFPYTYAARRQVWRWMTTYSSADDRWGLLGGLEYEDTTATLSDLTSADRTGTAAFAILRVKPAQALTVIGSVRYDDPSVYGSKVTARVSADWTIGQGFSVFAAWGEGYKTPTISQVACDFCFPAGPSVGLRPEEAEGYESALSWRSADDAVEIKATLYRLTVKGQIDFSASFPFRYANLEATRTDGVEVSADWRINDAWRVKGFYAWTDARDAVTDARLVRVPEHSGAVTVFWTGQDKGLTLTVRGEGEQADSPPARQSFVIADLAGYLDLNEGVRLTARIENLADQHYQETYGYGEPGVTAFVGVQLKSY